MARRGRLSAPLIVAGALLVALAIAGFLIGTRGDGDQASGQLSWAGAPRVTTPARLPRDRILTGRVRNDSLRTLRIRAREVEPVDAAGRPVHGAAVFVQSYVHGLYPPTREPRRLSERELRRTGRLAVIEPGGTAPLTVSWRLRDGRRPVRVDYGKGSLAIP